MRPLSLALYAAATALAEPLAPSLLRGRARRGKEDPERLKERLGRASVPRPPGPLVWLHGVSVGESLSLLPLVEALAKPGRTLLVTSGTRTSAELLAKRLPAGAIHQYAPIDAPGVVKRFLAHWRPDTAIQVESELWPNLILATKASGARMALVSARMTRKSAEGWARVPGAAHALVGAFDLVLAQDPDTDARLQSLGAATGPLLNLKSVGAPLPCAEADLAAFKAAAGARKVILAASTHPGEEEIIARAVQAAGADALLVIAPRHPDRGEAVATLLDQMGFSVARRSQGQALPSTITAYVADTLGEMGLFFRACDVAVMGGSFVPGIGGHNPLEPARLGATIVSGPHVFNAAATYAEMFEQVAAIECADEATLARDLRGLLTEPLIAARIGRAARAYAGRQGKAFEDALALLQPLLPV
ncbi:3-deoxy-D-manno-octulosonic acid transferase [Phenylobacterium sp.]|uniref:3-deoxy-D-manno-octulosonic acid transferase n=1 Tax=Phenylobacterium sp. TaxID=1871053 RepID=UPI0035B29B5C